MHFGPKKKKSVGREIYESEGKTSSVVRDRN